MYTTRQIEALLRHELDNWLYWARRRDWMPRSFSCVLGNLYVTPTPSGPADDLLPPRRFSINEADAAKMERFIIEMPEKQRSAFIAHHLDKCVIRGWVVRIKSRDDAAKCLNLGKSQYHEIVNSAHNTLWGKYESINTLRFGI